MASKEMTKVEGARLPMPYEAKNLGIDGRTWIALSNVVYKDVTDPQLLAVGLVYALANKLDPLRRPIEVVNFGGGNQVYLSIHGLTALAERGGFVGSKGAEFGPEIEYRGVKVPEWCEITIRKKDLETGEVYDFKGPRIYFKECARISKEGKLMSLWLTKPIYMLQKNTLAGTLRQAFPNTIGGNYEADEIADDGFKAKEVKPKSKIAEAIEITEVLEVQGSEEEEVLL